MDEPQLLADLYEGSHKAFTTLYNRYSQPLYYNILAMVKDGQTAEEFVQEIFTVIWENRATLRIHTGFGNYVFAASRNLIYNFLKKAGRQQALFEKLRAIATENYNHVEEALLARENKEMLQKAIATLPQQRRRAFVLCKIEGLSYKEAAEKMGLSLSSVKNHMALAREELRQYLNAHPETILLTLCFSILVNASTN